MEARTDRVTGASTRGFRVAVRHSCLSDYAQSEPAPFLEIVSAEIDIKINAA